MSALQSTHAPGPATITIKSYLPSSDFYMAAGTVTIDPVQQKVLICHDITTNTFRLPLGRKDWGESLPHTADRVTLGETGWLPSLLPVPLATRATMPKGALKYPVHEYWEPAHSAKFDETGDLLLAGSARLSDEPFAVTQHSQPNGHLAIVFWFVGVANSNDPPETNNQMVDKDYESLWVGYGEAVNRMVDDAYREVVRKGVELAVAVVDEDGAEAVLALETELES